MCLVVMVCRDDFAFLAEDDRALWYVGDRPEPFIREGVTRWLAPTPPLGFAASSGEGFAGAVGLRYLQEHIGPPDALAAGLSEALREFEATREPWKDAQRRPAFFTQIGVAPGGLFGAYYGAVNEDDPRCAERTAVAAPGIALVSTPAGLLPNDDAALRARFTAAASGGASLFDLVRTTAGLLLDAADRVDTVSRTLQLGILRRTGARVDGFTLRAPAQELVAATDAEIEARLQEPKPFLVPELDRAWIERVLSEAVPLEEPPARVPVLTCAEIYENPPTVLLTGGMTYTNHNVWGTLEEVQKGEAHDPIPPEAQIVQIRRADVDAAGFTAHSFLIALTDATNRQATFPAPQTVLNVGEVTGAATPDEAQLPSADLAYTVRGGIWITNDNPTVDAFVGVLVGVELSLADGAWREVGVDLLDFTVPKAGGEEIRAWHRTVGASEVEGPNDHFRVRLKGVAVRAPALPSLVTVRLRADEVTWQQAPGAKYAAAPDPMQYFVIASG